jgi:hypothetical protein
MKKYIIIKADTNDADYVQKKSLITDKQIEEEVLPIVKAIKDFNKMHQRGSGEYNWPNSEYRNETVEETYKDILTEEQIGIFDNYVPRGEYGIHTIESIEILTVVEELKLL